VNASLITRITEYSYSCYFHGALAVHDMYKLCDEGKFSSVIDLQGMGLLGRKWS
jgi:hypothetical protein